MPKAPQQDSYFIQKLYQTIQHSAHQVAEWDLTGKSFIVNDERAFTSTVLASEFGIGRFDSFARKVRVGVTQLNKYGFRRSKVQGNRVRFFHKEFNRDGKLLHKIRKLSKEETLPKHIKLQLIRSQRLQGSIKTEMNDLSPQAKVNSDLTWIGAEDQAQQSRSDIDIYLNKQVEMATSIIKPAL